MVCDYYIINQIKIEFKDGSDPFDMECNMKKAYFDDDNFDINSDDSDYEDQINDLILNKYLCVKYNPKIIFDKGSWLKYCYKIKYEEYLVNLKFDISKILRMTKNQVRRLY